MTLSKTAPELKTRCLRWRRSERMGSCPVEGLITFLAVEIHLLQSKQYAYTFQ